LLKAQKFKLTADFADLCGLKRFATEGTEIHRGKTKRVKSKLIKGKNMLKKLFKKVDLLPEVKDIPPMPQVKPPKQDHQNKIICFTCSRTAGNMTNKYQCEFENAHNAEFMDLAQSAVNYFHLLDKDHNNYIDEDKEDAAAKIKAKYGIADFGIKDFNHE